MPGCNARGRTTAASRSERRPCQYGGGVQQVVGIGSHALRTERLYALVVAVNCLTGVVDDSDAAVSHLHGNNSGVNVRNTGLFLQVRVNEAGTNSGDLNSLGTGYVANHIEVVDHHIVEDTAGNLDVGYRRRLRIAGGDLDDVDLADLAVTNHVVNCAVVVVEAAAETDLQLYASFLGCVDGSVNLLQIIIDRLLAEDVLACVSSLDDVLGMGVGRGANQNCIDLGIVQNVVASLVVFGMPQDLAKARSAHS